MVSLSTPKRLAISPRDTSPGNLPSSGGKSSMRESPTTAQEAHQDLPSAQPGATAVTSPSKTVIILPKLDGPARQRFNYVKGSVPTTTVSSNPASASTFAASRNAVKATSLISSTRASSLPTLQHHAHPATDKTSPRTDYRTSALKRLIGEEERDANQPCQHADSKGMMQPRDMPSPVKIQSHSENLKSLAMDSGSRDCANGIQRPLSRTSGDEVGAALPPSTIGSLRRTSIGERDTAVLSADASLPRASSPATNFAKGSKFARFRKIKSKSTVLFPPSDTATASDNVYNTGSVTTCQKNNQLEYGLDAASVILNEEGLNSNGSGTSSRSSLSEHQLKDVATRALQLVKLKTESQSERLQETSVKHILKLKRDQHQAKEAQLADMSPVQANAQHVDAPDSNIDRCGHIGHADRMQQDGPSSILIDRHYVAQNASGPLSNACTAPAFTKRRSERYAALKRRAEHRILNNAQLSKSTSDDANPPPVHPVYGYTNKYVVPFKLVHSQSSSSDSIPNNLSIEPSTSTRSSEGGPRAMRLAAIRNANPTSRLFGSVAREVECSKAVIDMAPTQEISQFEMHHTPRGSTTVIPTFENYVEQIFQAKRSSKANDSSRQTSEVSNGSWLIKNSPSPTYTNNLLMGSSRQSQSTTGDINLCLPVSVHGARIVGADDIHGKSTIGANAVNNADQSIVETGYDGPPLSYDASRYDDLETTNDGNALPVAVIDEQYTIISNEFERKPNWSSRKSDKSSRRSGPSSYRSDTSTGSQSYLNPLHWWQKNYSKRTLGDTNAIVSRALETVSPKASMRDKKKKKEMDEDVFEGLEEAQLSRHAGIHGASPINGHQAASEIVVPNLSNSLTLDPVVRETAPVDLHVAVLFDAKNSISSAAGIIPLRSSTEDTEVEAQTALPSNGSSSYRQDSTEHSQSTDHLEDSILVYLGYALVDTMQNACRVDFEQKASYADDELNVRKYDSRRNGNDEAHTKASIMDSSGTPQNMALMSLVGVQHRCWGENTDVMMDKPDKIGRALVSSTPGTNLECLIEAGTDDLQGQVNMTPVQDEQEIQNETKQNNISMNLVSSSTLSAGSIVQEFSPFVDRLLNKGIKVLKLGRQNKWQSRVLTASREMLTCDRKLEEPVVCPLALLWQKAFDVKSSSVMWIKKQGRGGMYFKDVLKTATGFGDITVPPIPRRSSAKFSGIFGAMVSYKQDDGIERLITLAFKSQADADMFATSIPVMKKVLANAKMHASV